MGPLRPAFYCELVARKIDFDSACSIYLDWALGIRRFDRLAEARQAVGINPRWPLRELHAGKTFTGGHDARLSTRRAEGMFLMHMVHRDEVEPSEFWHNVVELSPADRGTRVRHGCGRTGPAGHELRPKIGAPGVVRRLLKWNGPDIEPLDIGDASVVHVRADDAAEVLDYFVLDARRRNPVLLVTPDHEIGAPLVDPEALAARLAGLVRVLVCADEAAVRAFTRALQRAGFAFQFAAGDGAIRLYLAGMDPGDSPHRHRFWTRVKLGGQGPEELARLAGEIAESAMRGMIPRFFFEAVERFDRAAVERRAELLLRDTQVIEDLERQQAANLDLRAQLTAVRVELHKVQGDYDAAVRLMEEETLRRDAREQQLEAELEAVRAAEKRLEALLRAHQAQSKASGGIPEARRQALAAAIEGAIPTPEQCLDILECLYGDRIEILESARASARHAASFRYGDRLLRLLVTLATDYWQRMVEGGGDGSAKQVFGDSAFAAKESRTAMSNERARRERTFVYRGQTYLMWRHLKIGAKDAALESIRVYFDWLADERKILIGHCGEHLYLPSFGM